MKHKLNDNKLSSNQPRPKAKASVSMGEYVTPHAEISKKFRFLACGIDSLDIAAYVDWGDEWLTLMNDLGKGREKAQDVNKPFPWRKTSLGPCLIYPTGRPPMYRYHLQIRELHMYTSISQSSSDYPNVYISLNSKHLWTQGIEEVVLTARKLIEEFGGKINQFKPSRCDLCVDYHIPGGMGFDFLRALGVPENIKLISIMLGGQLETFYIGSPKASIRARIYDKSKEVIKNKKYWFTQIWDVEECKDIWRLEFQLRRTALKAYDLNTVYDLINNLGGMWEDLTHSWYSLRLRDNKNTSRRSFHPWWIHVQKSSDRFGPVTNIKRNLEPCGKADWKFYMARAASCLVGYAACMGFAELEEAVTEFSGAISDYWNDNKDFLEAYTIKVVELDVPINNQGGDDDKPF